MKYLNHARFLAPGLLASAIAAYLLIPSGSVRIQESHAGASLVYESPALWAKKTPACKECRVSFRSCAKSARETFRSERQKIKAGEVTRDEKKAAIAALRETRIAAVAACQATASQCCKDECGGGEEPPPDGGGGGEEPPPPPPPPDNSACLEACAQVRDDALRMCDEDFAGDPAGIDACKADVNNQHTSCVAGCG